MEDKLNNCANRRKYTYGGIPSEFTQVVCRPKRGVTKPSPKALFCQYILNKNMQQLTTKYHLTALGILLSFLLTLHACSTIKKIDRAINKGTQELEEKINNCNNNKERFHLLLQGNYIVHLETRPGVIGLWRSRVDGDSLLTCMHPIGNPSKDGCLLLYGNYLTQSSDQPIANYIIRVEQESRDTLALWIHSCRLYTLQEMLDKKIEQELDLKTHIDTSHSESHGFYVKESNTKFNFNIARDVNPYAGDDLNQQLYGQTGYIGLNKQEIKIMYYTKEGELTSNVYNYYFRRYHLDLQKWCAVVQEE